MELLPQEEKVVRPSCSFCDDCNKAALYHCAECDLLLCQDARQVHNKSRAIRSHRLESVIPTTPSPTINKAGDKDNKEKEKEEEGKTDPTTFKPTPPNCGVHGLAVVFFCETDQTTVCMECITTTHNGHKFVKLDAIEQKKREQTPALSKHAQQVVDAFLHLHDIVKQQKEAADITKQSSSESVLAYMRAIRDVIDRLIKQREAELIKQVCDIAQNKLDILQRYDDDIAAILPFVQRVLGCAHDIIDSCDEHSATQINKELQQVIDLQSSPLLNVQVENGNIQYNVDIQSIENQLAPIFLSLGSFVTSPSIPITPPVIPLPHLPQPVVAVPPKPSFDMLGTPRTYGDNDGMFNCPRGLTVDNDNGNVIVADPYNHRVQIFSVSGQFIIKFGSDGDAHGQLGCPWDMTINRQGEIIVSEYDNNRISIFTREGQFLRTFGSQGNGDGQLSHPTGVTVDGNNNIIVVDHGNNRVQVFSENGDFIASFGSEGNANGQFNDPYGVVVDRNGNILATDCNNHRIQLFNSTYQYITQFGEEEVSRPLGLTITPQHEIVVCSYGNNKLCVFDEEGNHLRDIALPSYPQYVTVTEGGTAIVSFDDHTVRVISYM